MKETIFVTGATGNVGSEAADYAQVLGFNVVRAIRGSGGADRAEGLGFKPFDFTDRRSWGPCLDGVDKVFLMRPPHISKIKRDMYPFMKYLKEKKIRQVVFLSVQGVEGNKKIPHYDVEQFCIELGLPYTFIRPSFFMQNLTTAHLPEIRDDNMLFVPAGKGKTNFIDVRDIGEIAARLFTDETHIGRAYTITGEKSYSYGEVADYLSRGLGRQIRYEDPGPLNFVKYHRKRGRKMGMILVMLMLYGVVKRGKADITTGTSSELLGRTPRSLEAFIDDYRDIMTGEG